MQLKATKWVCMFIYKNDVSVKKSEFNYKFYFFLVDRLNKEYKSTDIKELNGLPSPTSISNVYNYFKALEKTDRIKSIENILREERESLIHKQIYTTYKAASYYVNMAKDKLKIITEENELTEKGKELIRMKSSFFKLSVQEKNFYFERLIEVDSLMILTIPLFKKLSFKYKRKEYTELQLEFLEIYYKIRYSYFTKTSLSNYEAVREHWVENLNLLDKNLNLRAHYKNIIFTKTDHASIYTKILENFDDYKKNHFKINNKYNINREMFEINYQINIDRGSSDNGYVNLYDIKEKMNLSHSAFESFLNDYNHKEKKSRVIFFSNLVNSIDRRQRFEVKGVPVLKIKIRKI
ncbi:hypothetical protein [Fibrella musci]|uniref:hypothetical protein n=1 Tax=Fibrella musci TaxID=3242485 RepID=UPI0035200A03